MSRRSYEGMKEEVSRINKGLPEEKQIKLSSRYDYYALENKKGNVVLATGLSLKDVDMFLTGFCAGLRKEF